MENQGVKFKYFGDIMNNEAKPTTAIQESPYKSTHNKKNKVKNLRDHCKADHKVRSFLPSDRLDFDLNSSFITSRCSKIF